MPLPRGHGKFQDECLVEMFLKSFVSPNKILEYFSAICMNLCLDAAVT